MTNQKATSTNVARSIASLNNDLAAALAHQAYAHKNPDSNVDADLLTVMGYGFEQLLDQYSEVDEKRIDLLNVKAGIMTADELIAKYSIDLTVYSNSLI